jgi:3-oxoacyl-[acyl-carrier-protein] synthase II
VSADAHSLVAPPDTGEGAVRAMRGALKDAKLDGSAIGYINAHGTSTQQGDLAETRAIHEVFGAHAKSVAVSSTKSMTGHLLGAAGSAEAAFALLALERGVLPPTINLEKQDPACDLDYVPNVAREMPVANAMSNSLGFGGHNAVLLFGKV